MIVISTTDTPIHPVMFVGHDSEPCGNFGTISRHKLPIIHPDLPIPTRSPHFISHPEFLNPKSLYQNPKNLVNSYCFLVFLDFAMLSYAFSAWWPWQACSLSPWQASSLDSVLLQAGRVVVLLNGRYTGKKRRAVWAWPSNSLFRPPCFSVTHIFE